MKTKTKKSGIAATAALLILTVMLVTGCSGPETGGSGYTPPAGMGAVKLNLNPIIARSLLPDVDPDDFDEFDLTFSVDGGGVGTSDSFPNVGKSTLTTERPLAVGGYLLDVIAYIGGNALAFQADLPVTITAGNTTDITITLAPLEPDGITTGTFSYIITNAGKTISAAKIDLIPVVTGATLGTAVMGTDVLLDIGAGAKTIDGVYTGYYYMDLTITKGGVTVVFRHIVHIYEGMTSLYEFNITDTYINATLTGFAIISVEFEINDLKPILSPAGPIALVKSGTASQLITISNAGSFDSLEWYSYTNTKNTISGNTFTVSSAAAPFDIAGRAFILTVVGIKDDIPYSTFITVTVAN